MEWIRCNNVLSLKIHCKNKRKNIYLYLNVKRRQDHFYNYNHVDCAASEKYDGGNVWYLGMCF